MTVVITWVYHCYFKNLSKISLLRWTPQVEIIGAHQCGFWPWQYHPVIGGRGRTNRIPLWVPQAQKWILCSWLGGQKLKTSAQTMRILECHSMTRIPHVASYTIVIFTVTSMGTLNLFNTDWRHLTKIISLQKNTIWHVPYGCEGWSLTVRTHKLRMFWKIKGAE